MAEKPQPNGARTGQNQRRSGHVGLGRRWVARRMIVGYGEGPAVVAEHRVEYLAHRHQGTVHRAFRGYDGLGKSVATVTYEDEHTLTPEMSEMLRRNSGDVGRASQKRHLMMPLGQGPQAQGCRQGSGLGRSKSRHGRELLWPSAGQPANPPDWATWR